MDWYAGVVEKGGLHPFSMEKFIERGRNRKVDDDVNKLELLARMPPLLLWSEPG
jgi:hypothetical protein